MERQCDLCGVTYTAQRPTSRWCSPSCRVKNSRGAVVAATAASAPPAEPSAPGPVESSVRDSLDHLLNGHPMGDALAEMSYALARTLDGGTSLATAAVNRELRANLMEIARLAVNGADDLAIELSTPAREDETAQRAADLESSTH